MSLQTALEAALLDIIKIRRYRGRMSKRSSLIICYNMTAAGNPSVTSESSGGVSYSYQPLTKRRVGSSGTAHALTSGKKVDGPHRWQIQAVHRLRPSGPPQRVGYRVVDKLPHPPDEQVAPVR